MCLTSRSEEHMKIIQMETTQASHLLNSFSFQQATKFIFSVEDFSTVSLLLIILLQSLTHFCPPFLDLNVLYFNNPSLSVTDQVFRPITNPHSSYSQMSFLLGAALQTPHWGLIAEVSAPYPTFRNPRNYK